MAIRSTASNIQPTFRTAIGESLEDSVSGELMTKAVTLFPCGHVFNEDTVIQCLARNKLCPLDRQPIERYIPNYTIRHMAEATGSAPPEIESPSRAAEEQFEQGKKLSEQGHPEAAITYLLQALQLTPTYEKAQAYLDFCLQKASAPLLSQTVSSSPYAPPRIFSSALLATSEKACLAPPDKESYTELVLNLLEEPAVQSNPPLLKLLTEHVENLMGQDSASLNPSQQETYKWTQKLVVDHKVRQFVADKLQQIHSGTPSLSSSSFLTSSLASNVSTASPAVTTSSLTNALPPAASVPFMAFGAAKWAQYIGDVGAEPPLPPNISQILKSPCPIWPGKRVKETHVLTLIPQTVNGQPLTLKLLGDLVQKPLKGNAIKYSTFYPGEYTDPPAPASHWVLMSRDVIPGSRHKSYADQQVLVASTAQKAQVPYQVPNLLDGAVSILMEYVSSGTRMYSDSPWTSTRCQEKYNAGYQLVVGGFSSGGLIVLYASYDDECVGVSVLRKFS